MRCLAACIECFLSFLLCSLGDSLHAIAYEAFYTRCGDTHTGVRANALPSFQIIFGPKSNPLTTWMPNGVGTADENPAVTGAGILGAGMLATGAGGKTQARTTGTGASGKTDAGVTTAGDMHEHGNRMTTTTQTNKQQSLWRLQHCPMTGKGIMYHTLIGSTTEETTMCTTGARTTRQKRHR